MSEERKPYVRECGCTHRGPGHEWERCETHQLYDDVEKQLEKTFGKPVCPEGCGDARRPKCMWEAFDCPRHDVTHAWNQLVGSAVGYIQVVRNWDD